MTVNQTAPHLELKALRRVRVMKPQSIGLTKEIEKVLFEAGGVTIRES